MEGVIKINFNNRHNSYAQTETVVFTFKRLFKTLSLTKNLFGIFGICSCPAPAARQSEASGAG